MILPLRKLRFTPGLQTIGFLVIAAPVVVVIAAALWLSTTAAYENVKFGRGTEQILSLIAIMRDDASIAPNFGATPNEDLIDDLMRLGQYTARPDNVWDAGLRATAPTTALMRIETDIPGRACRRLALYFAKEADNIALQKMESLEPNGSWRAFFSNPSDRSLNFAAADSACGKSERMTLALTLKLR